MTPESKRTVTTILEIVLWKQLRITIAKQQDAMLAMHRGSSNFDFFTGLKEGYKHTLQIIDQEINKL